MPDPIHPPGDFGPFLQSETVPPLTWLEWFFVTVWIAFLFFWLFVLPLLGIQYLCYYLKS